mgnify:CR=1 FL=1
MQQVLEDFYKVVRSSGVKISPSDSIETSRSVTLVGYQNRSILKHALTVSLAKSLDDQHLIDECFEQFFKFDAFQQPSANDVNPGGDADDLTGDPENNSEQAQQDSEPYQSDTPLTNMLLERDHNALAVEMQRAAQEVGLRDIWFFTQKSLYTQRIMQKMGLRDLQNEIRALSDGSGNNSGNGDCPSNIAQEGQLRDAKAWLFEEVKDFVEQQLGMYGKTSAKSLREQHLKKTKLSNIEKRDFHTMHDLVRKMAKRLSSMYSKKKKRKNRGQLDFRKTLRSNVAYDGILFETYWKSRYIDKPKVLVLCDISGSVQAYSRFLLLFLYSLNDVLNRIDSYVFTGNLISVDDIFAHYPVEEAIDKIIDDHGMGGSDYGTMLLDLERQCMDTIDNKTTVLILGDARNNNLAPRSEVLELAYQRAKRIIWLNPEPENFWKTGDSVMLNYRPYCHLAKTCNTLDHLERLLDELLKAATATV